MTEQLLDVVDVLTLEHPYQATVEGKPRWVRRDPLIKTLRDLIASSLTGGNGTASNTSRLPFDADAMELYDRLELQILANFAGNAPHLLPEDNLRAWYVTYTAANPTDVETWTGKWGHWVAVIEAKIGRPVVLELIDEKTHEPVPCPECGFGWFTVPLNSGSDGKGGTWVDSEQRVALTAIYRPDGHGGLESSTVECGCCHWRVSGSHRIREFAWNIERKDTAA